VTARLQAAISWNWLCLARLSFFQKKKAMILSKSAEAFKLVMTHDLLLTRGRHALICTQHYTDGAMNKRLLGSCPLQQSW
jgi:hypothetical protein